MKRKEGERVGVKGFPQYSKDIDITTDYVLFFFNFTKTSYLFSDDIKEALYFCRVLGLTFLVSLSSCHIRRKKKDKNKRNRLIKKNQYLLVSKSHLRTIVSVTV